MKQLPFKIKPNWLTRGTLSRLAVITLLASMLPLPASAAQMTNRSLTLSSTSAAASNATTTYKFGFTVPSTTAIQSFTGQVCTTASGTCNTPTGFSLSSSSLASQPTGMGAASGWTASTATAGTFKITNSSNSTAPSGSQQIIFNNVQNPTTTNTSFYVRLTTYSDAAYTTAIDSGSTSTSTANQITFSGTVDESLTFCVGVTVTNNCSSTSGTAVSFSPSSTFSTSSVTTATSQFAAATNASSGYVVTATGATLTSGSNTIAAAQTNPTANTTNASSPGSSQFGFNISANHKTSASVGAASTNYATASQYRYLTGDTIAQSSVPSDFDTYTANYIVNISGVQAAGNYTTTLTFICTATF